MHEAETTISFSPEAIKTLDAMSLRCDLIAEYYGETHPRTFKANASLRRALMAMLRLGGHITKDGDISLYGASYMHYGVIFFGDKNADEMIDEQGKKFTMKGIPETGEWSVHS